jgi:hypothetical protein
MRRNRAIDIEGTRSAKVEVAENEWRQFDDSRVKAEALRRCVADAALARDHDSDPSATLFAAGIDEIVGRLPAPERRTQRTVWDMQTALTFDPEETSSPRLDDRSRDPGSVLNDAG